MLIFIILFIPLILFGGIIAKEAYDLIQMANIAVLRTQIEQLFANNSILNTVNSFLANSNIQITGEELNKGISQLGKLVGIFILDQANAITANVLNFVFNSFQIVNNY